MPTKKGVAEMLLSLNPEAVVEKAASEISAVNEQSNESKQSYSDHSLFAKNL